jgi:hypothetical protein
VVDGFVVSWLVAAGVSCVVVVGVSLAGVANNGEADGVAKYLFLPGGRWRARMFV